MSDAEVWEAYLKRLYPLQFRRKAWPRMRFLYHCDQPLSLSPPAPSLSPSLSLPPPRRYRVVVVVAADWWWWSDLAALLFPCSRSVQISSPLSLVSRSGSRSRLRWSVLNPSCSNWRHKIESMPSRGIIMAIYDRGGGQFREGPTCRNSDSHVGAGGGWTLERGTLSRQAGTRRDIRWSRATSLSNLLLTPPFPFPCPYSLSQSSDMSSVEAYSPLPIAVFLVPNAGLIRVE
uniref:Uncharacterized protein n=1 Tax=Brassica oleracea var. oleracea TaxID=109376 RepID=A0A0D3CE74_BRAOL